MIVRVSRNFGLVIASFVVGCASTPKLRSEVGLLRVSDIVDNVRCELKEANVPFLKEKGGWNAGVDLSLNAVGDSTASLGGGSEAPYVPQLLNVNLVTSVGTQADRNVGFVWTIDLGKEDEIKCTEVHKRRFHGVRLVGDLGIQSWLQQVQDIFSETRTRPDKVNYSLQFVLTEAADASITITKIPHNEDTANFGFGLKGASKDVNKIIVTFNQKAADTPKTNPPVAVPPRGNTPKPGEKVKPSTPAAPEVDPREKPGLLNDLQLLGIEQSIEDR